MPAATGESSDIAGSIAVYGVMVQVMITAS
jgi:hypothetical protein